MAEAPRAPTAAGAVRATGARPLPRGRHKLEPAQVIASQRARLFSAMASVTASKGYAATTVADLLVAAGVSRETFYEQFDSKLDCFEQAFDDASTLLFAVIAESAARNAPRHLSAGNLAEGAGEDKVTRRVITPESQHDEVTGTRRRRAVRFEKMLGAYLDALATYPELARLCLVEVYAAGPAMARRRAEVQERFSEQIQRMFGARDAEERFACQALVAAIGGMVTEKLAVGEGEDLRLLREPLGALVRRALR